MGGGAGSDAIAANDGVLLCYLEVRDVCPSKSATRVGPFSFKCSQLKQVEDEAAFALEGENCRVGRTSRCT